MFEIDNLDKSIAINLNPQSLAFVGDAVFSLYIRQRIVLADEVNVNLQHKLTTNYVKASGQSEIIAKISELLTEEELKIFKRARNYKTNNIAKNAKVVDYKRATGLEALIGYLYLTGNNNRLTELLNIGYDIIHKEINNNATNRG